ncbi:hypothetical protein wVul_0121 [Wolbachia endosymbiont of Armadillidium vulgare str. wVulC]|nr:hypothetical protein wVul_0121 [Wolbachia endosymbiont of Armadillidium vulgare str. wVulC]
MDLPITINSAPEFIASFKVPEMISTCHIYLKSNYINTIFTPIC